MAISMIDDSVIAYVRVKAVAVSTIEQRCHAKSMTAATNAM
jgi:hypothetical protein